MAKFLCCCNKWRCEWNIYVSKCAFKEASQNYILIFLLQDFLWLILLPFSIAIFWNYYLMRPLRNGDLNVAIYCWVCGVCQKMQVGNCIKRLSVRRVDYVVDWNSFSCDKSHICFTQLAEAKFSTYTFLYHRRNDQY